MADKDKRQSKRLDRIERRLDRGMKSARQASRNVERAEKIALSNDRLYSRAAGVADRAHDQEVNILEGADAFNNPIKKTGPFYKTGDINYSKGNPAKPDNKNKAKRSRLSEVPTYTDSLSVHMQNSAQKEYNMNSSWNDISTAVQKKFGQLDVSNFKIDPSQITNVKETRKKYNLPRK